jgi:hypothetical protein
MRESEARAILKARGWTWQIRLRRRGTPYLYAKRHRRGAPGSKFEERYIGPLSRLPAWTEADLVTKLTR